MASAATMGDPAVQTMGRTIDGPLKQPLSPPPATFGGKHRPKGLEDDRAAHKGEKFVILGETVGFFARGEVVEAGAFQDGTNLARLLRMCVIRLATPTEAGLEEVDLPDTERHLQNRSVNDENLALKVENKELKQRVTDLETQVGMMKSAPPTGYDPAQAEAMQRLIAEKDDVIDQLQRENADLKDKPKRKTP